MEKYNHKKIEKKWQDKWEEKEIYKAEDPLPARREGAEKPKKYILIEFPYPSGAGLHVGHCRPYCALDALARKKKMEGDNVLFPIGWDAFGLPTENFAIKNKIHPQEATEKNIANFKKQIKSLGLSFDWSREINTTDPKYYKWTQWIFLKLFEKGLAYQAEMPINWCPSCKIGLANEEVVNGKCERCGTPTEKKIKKQWMLKITAYADKLIEGLEKVDYPERVKTQQINWIGKSCGAEIKFPLATFAQNRRKTKNAKPREIFIKVFTTRPDTLFGCTYLVVCPEHSIVASLLKSKIQTSNYSKSNQKSKFQNRIEIENLEEVENYLKEVKKKSDLERTDLAKEKTGIELKGIKAINPVNNKEIPIFVADYVLPHYGTGAIMAVPAHDERDFEFAKKFDLEINPVIKSSIKQTKAQKQTIESYDKNVNEYYKKTISKIEGGLKEWIDYILSLIDKDAKILELGSGTGKDADYIENLEYKVERTDGSIGFVKYQKSKGKSINMLELINDEIDYLKYDLIFANAVLLHFNKQQTELILKKINNGLKKNGILAFSVKSGKCEEITNRKIGANRYFKYWEINEIKQILNKFPFEIVKLEPWKDRRGVVFLWIVVKKKTDSVDLIYEGINFNSDFLNGLETEKAKEKITKWLEEKGVGKRAVNYKLRDWIFSRQHYWGEPIPLIFCENCKKLMEKSKIKNQKSKIRKFNKEELLNPGWVSIPEKDLPVELPYVENYQPTKTGESPLTNISEWVNVKCPKCGHEAKRETDTMPNWAGSSWYFLRYLDPKNNKALADFEKIKYWMPVDFYNGGMEHTTLHLLYSRFWYKFLFDIGIAPQDEPYQKRTSHGMVLAEDGRKMSKSFGNVINPDDVVKKFGADSLRLYEMFMGPFEQTISWNEKGLVGMERFLKRVWKLFQETMNKEQRTENTKYDRLIHQTIKKVTEDIDNFKFNTAISQLMILLNEMEKEKQHQVLSIKYQVFLKLLSPFAPHIAEELYQQVKSPAFVLEGTSAGKQNSKQFKSIFEESWPKYDEELIKEEKINLIIQINGKVRDQIEIDAEISEQEAKEIALSQEKVVKWIEGRPLKKIIFIKNRLINIVV